MWFWEVPEPVHGVRWRTGVARRSRKPALASQSLIPINRDGGQVPWCSRPSCRCFADLPAYGSMGPQITCAELDRENLAFAAWLQKSLALRTGDRVAHGNMVANVQQLAAWMAGGIADYSSQFTRLQVDTLHK